MQAISHALHEREAALLTVQAITDERDKKRQAVNTADENSSDKNRCRRCSSASREQATKTRAELHPLWQGQESMGPAE